jgi:hypothetical protein
MLHVLRQFRPSEFFDTAELRGLRRSGIRVRLKREYRSCFVVSP